MNVYMVSVVRDYSMYGRCILDNPFCRDFRKYPLDNLRENLPITVRYNRWLDSFDGDEGWIIFCHEDWKPLEDLVPILEKLDKGKLYGPIGSYVEQCEHSDFQSLRGFVIQSRKDGSHVKQLHAMVDSEEVDTVDCQCLMVHSSLLREYGLRFDENLSFDLYVEDFCAWAHYKYGISTEVVIFQSQHFSEGVAGERFYASLDYLRKKYASSPKRYGSTVGRFKTFGGNIHKRIFMRRKTLLTKIRYRIMK